MPSIKIDSNDFDLNKVLNGISDLSINDLKEVLTQVQTFIARKKVPHFNKEEATLITKIHSGLPEDKVERYATLQMKLLEEKITDEEHQELLGLIKIFERKSNERLKYIIELSLLWNTDVDTVMEKLDLKTPPTLHV